MKFLVLVLALGFAVSSAFPFGTMGFFPGMFGAGFNMMNPYGRIGLNRYRANRRPMIHNKNYYDDENYMYESYGGGEDEWQPRHTMEYEGATHPKQRNPYESDHQENYVNSYRPTNDNHKTKVQNSKFYHDREYGQKQNYDDIERYVRTHKNTNKENYYHAL